MLECRPFDLVLLDIMMPDMNGFQVLQRLKSDDNISHIPVIMLSAVAKKTFAHYVKMLNIRMNETIPEPDAYVEKPPDAEELLRLALQLAPRKEGR